MGTNKNCLRSACAGDAQVHQNFVHAFLCTDINVHFYILGQKTEMGVKKEKMGWNSIFGKMGHFLKIMIFSPSPFFSAVRTRIQKVPFFFRDGFCAFTPFWGGNVKSHPKPQKWEPTKIV